MSPGLLLDTYALIRVADDEGLIDAARRLVNLAAKTEQIFVSPISAWEIANLVRNRRLVLTMPPETWFDAALHLPGIQLAQMSPATLIASAFLPGTPPSDPADRIIIATARAENFTLMTRDAEILAYAETGHVRVTLC